MASVTRDADPEDPEANQDSESVKNPVDLTTTEETSEATQGAGEGDPGKPPSSSGSTSSTKRQLGPNIMISHPPLSTSESEDKLENRTKDLLAKLRTENSDGSSSGMDALLGIMSSGGGAGMGGSRRGSDVGGASAGMGGVGSIRDKRKERRRRQGSGVGAQAPLPSAQPEPPVPALPSAEELQRRGSDVGQEKVGEERGGSEGGEVGGGSGAAAGLGLDGLGATGMERRGSDVGLGGVEGDMEVSDEVVNAKRALLAMATPTGSPLIEVGAFEFGSGSLGGGEKKEGE